MPVIVVIGQPVFCKCENIIVLYTVQLYLCTFYDFIDYLVSVWQNIGKLPDFCSLLQMKFCHRSKYKQQIFFSVVNLKLSYLEKLSNYLANLEYFYMLYAPITEKTFCQSYWTILKYQDLQKYKNL